MRIVSIPSRYIVNVLDYLCKYSVNKEWIITHNGSYVTLQAKEDVLSIAEAFIAGIKLCAIA